MFNLDNKHLYSFPDPEHQPNGKTLICLPSQKGFPSAHQRLTPLTPDTSLAPADLAAHRRERRTNLNLALKRTK